MVDTTRGNRNETETLDVDLPRQPLSALVRISKGHGSPKTFRLAAGTCRLGAHADNDIVIEDSAVSRRHLDLTLVPEGVLARDLKSRNGTFYAGGRVGEMTLALGSQLTLGTTEISLEPDVEAFEGTRSAERTAYGELIGESPAMRHLFTLMTRLEGSLVNVLIQGESGTGKELIAQALHQQSLVAHGPFIVINCGALDRALVRSELFGHKKGAFTGATTEHTGAFADADGGTLFLDEIGELPLDIQPVLLRALEAGSYSRVGETKTRHAKVRVIAATNRKLAEEVEEGSFRADLYYRLMVVRLTVPPLRHRPEDVALLTRFFAEAAGLTPTPPELLAGLANRQFPGNVRELRHLVQAYAAIGELPDDHGRAGTDDSNALAHPALAHLDAALRMFVNPTEPYAEQKEQLVNRMTRIYLEELIERTQGNRSEAARIAGLQRGYLRRLLEKYGLTEGPEN